MIVIHDKFSQNNNKTFKQFWCFSAPSFLKVAQEIWVCENQAITKWKKDILAYKEHLKTKIEKQQTHDI